MGRWGIEAEPEGEDPVLSAARLRTASLVERGCAWLVVALGASVLVGGAFDVVPLTRWWAHLPVTVPVTGLVLVAIGGGLLLRAHWLAALVVSISGLLLATLSGVARAASWRHPFETWLIPGPVSDPQRHGLPPFSTVGGLIVSSLGVVLIVLGKQRSAQVLAALGAAVGWLAVLSVLYGDRLSTISDSSFPETTTSLPAGIALLAAGAAVFAASPTEGVSGWLGAESPGRRAVRRLLPAVLAVPLLLAAAARWLDLDGRLGAPRSWAVVMTVVSAGICVIAVVAVPLIDDLSAAARRSEVTELRLSVALRAGRVADLSQALTAAVTVEQVSEIVSSLAGRVVEARAASVGIIERASRTLHVHHGPGVSADIRALYSTPSLDTPLAFTDAARTGEIVLVRDYEEYQQRYPSSDPSNAQLGQGGRAAMPLMNRSGTTFGALALSWDGAIEFDDTLLSTLTTVAELVAQSLERARLTDEAAQEALRNAKLAGLAEALATAHNTGDVLSFLADRVTDPLDADTAVVGLMDREHNVFRRHFPSHMAPLDDILGTEPLDRPLPLLDAARSGVPVLLGDRDQIAELYPEALAVFDVAGIMATANLPLRDRRGESFGALGVAWLRPIVFDQRLQALLSTIAELAAQTLERAWLADSSEADRDRAQHLAKLAEALAVAQSISEVERVIRDTAAEVVGAAATRFEPVSGLGGPREHRDTVELGGDDEADDDTIMSMPIIASDEEPLGVLILEWHRPIVVDESMRSTLTTMGELLAQTLERVDLAEAEHRLIEGLQRRIIKAIPETPGLEVTARYEPAAQRIGMGGDWYEGLSLDDEGGARLGLVVGDVVGHGVESAVEMTQLSGVLSTLVRVRVPLDSLFTRVHEVVQPLSIYATALVGVFDVAAGRLELASAGHLPPVLIDGDGARLLVVAQHPMIGVPPNRRGSILTEFGPGSTLVAFTDGLVERRHQPLDDSLERLRALCEQHATLPGEELVDLIITTFLGDATAEDDLAVVVVRAVGSEAVSNGGAPS